MEEKLRRLGVCHLVIFCRLDLLSSTVSIQAPYEVVRRGLVLPCLEVAHVVLVAQSKGNNRHKPTSDIGDANDSALTRAHAPQQIEPICPFSSEIFRIYSYMASGVPTPILLVCSWHLMHVCHY